MVSLGEGENKALLFQLGKGGGQGTGFHWGEHLSCTGQS